MSFIYSQALVEAFSEANCSGTDAFAQLSENPTLKPSWWHDKTMEPSRHSRFGMTYAPLTDALGEDLLTSYLAAFRVRTSALQELVRELRGGVEVASGAKWPASSVRFDPASSSWKTAHCLWEEDLPSSSVILPRWGMTRSGHVFQHPTAERPISAIVSGLWATPSTTDGTRGGRITENMTGISLDQQINTPRRWPTPKANDAEKRGNFDMNNPRNGLPAAVMRYPTPTASASKGWSKNHNRANSDDRLDYTIERQAFQPGQTTPPKRLNPLWVEWLMGWPPGWTDLKPLAMDRFREWQRQHSPCLQESKEAA